MGASRRGSLRITGGALRGRLLRAPAGGARPTAERVREALFARLGDLEGAAVIDLYAGSGALGIEALSRGAGSVLFVERAPASLRALRRNLADLELGLRTRVRAGDVPRVVRGLARERPLFDLALLDPPYASGDAARALEALAEAGILAPGATLVVERGWRHPVPRVAGFAVRDERRYGDTVIERLVCEAGGDPGVR